MNTYDSRGRLKVAQSGVATADIIVLQDQKAAAVHGGTFTSGAWRTRDLNTKVTDTRGLCTLTANQFTLPAGTYEILATVPGVMCNQHVARLQNISDGTTTLLGTAECSGVNTVEIGTNSTINGRFSIVTAKTFEIQHYCTNTRATNGFGVQNSPIGVTEIFTQVYLRKLVQPLGIDSDWGTVVQRAYAETNAITSTTAVIPIDDSIPQIGEGAELLTASITPKSATNRVRIRFQTHCTVGTNGITAIAALFWDSVVDALSAKWIGTIGVDQGHFIALEFEHVPGDTAAHTYRIRYGPGSAATMRINSYSASRLLGGAMKSTLVVEEVKA